MENGKPEAHRSTVYAVASVGLLSSIDLFMPRLKYHQKLGALFQLHISRVTPVFYGVPLFLV
jgi:hypothetical protein